MPIQILPRVPGLGEQITTGLGAGLGAGLQALAHWKMQQMAQQQERARLMPGLTALGYSPEEAESLAQLPLQLQGIALKEKIRGAQMAPFLGQLQQLYGLGREEVPPPVTSLAPTEVMPPAPEMPTVPPPAVTPRMPEYSLYGALPRKEEELYQLGILKRPSLLERQFPAATEEAAGIPTPPSVLTKKIERAPEVVQPVTERRPLSEGEATQLLASAATGDVRQMVKTVRDIEKGRQKEAQLEKKMAFEREREAARERREEFKEAKKERIEAFKLTKAERKEIMEKAKSSRQNIQDLERMEALDAEGKLDTPGYVEFLKRTGLDVPALMNPGSQEFNKIVQTFLRDARSYFGARVTNFELDQFLKGIPSLSQSPEGRKRVIANLKRFNRVALLYNDALKEVISDNKGIPPLDLLEKIDDKIGNKIDKISDQFKEDLKKPVPPGQAAWKTALQSIAGSVIGFPGAIISKLAGRVGGVPTE